MVKDSSFLGCFRVGRGCVIMWGMLSRRLLVGALPLCMASACGTRAPTPPLDVPTLAEVEAPPRLASESTREAEPRKPESAPESAPELAPEPAPESTEAPRERCEPLDSKSPELAEIEGATWLIRFPKNRYDPVSKEGLAEIDRVASVLKRVPLACVEISGHVAHQPGAGLHEYGQDLSLRRANRVRELLIERGVPAWRLDTRGAGVDEPVATNSTAAGRRKNERIEFTVLDSLSAGEERSP